MCYYRWNRWQYMSNTFLLLSSCKTITNVYGYFCSSVRHALYIAVTKLTNKYDDDGDDD